MDKKYEYGNNKVFLDADQFCDQIQFRFGIPLIVLDFIDFMTGSDFIANVQLNVNPEPLIDRFDPQNTEFKDLKDKVEDEFLPYIFNLFDALGAVDLKKLGRTATPEEKESK